VWIEHVVRALLSTVDRLVCLAAGELVADGAPHDVLAMQRVKELFLGMESTAVKAVETGQSDVLQVASPEDQP
jgi:ABC-type lipopolysaccharide export system ATPase subunit